MSTLAEIDSAIRRLPPAQAWELARSFQEHLGDLWDGQFEADVKAGSLDKLIARAGADYAAGRCRPLDEIIGKP